MTTFSDWQALAPEAAARDVHLRARTHLSAAQQRAAIAWLRPEEELAADFAAARARGGPLAGIPVFVKDLFDVAGAPTLAGSTFLEEVRPGPHVDSALIRTLREAGAVIAGKTHLHEFAYGITGENPHYGDCERPGFPGRTTGGSSSGSAAAVAAGVVPFALGSDTGGSVRVPAAFCGLFGFRMTPRDAWIHDAIPLAPSFDSAGWFTANAGDLRATLAALLDPIDAGPVVPTATEPRRDRPPVKHSGPAASRPAPPATTPRGLYLEFGQLDDDVAHACRAAAGQLATPADANTREALLRGFAPALDAYHTIVAHEARAYHEPWIERFRDRYDPAVWQRLQRGPTIADEAIAAARRTLATVRDVWAQFFAQYDFLVLPASPCAALTKSGCTLENRNRLIALTAPASVGGLPVLTLAVPLPNGLTTGLQIVVHDSRSPAVKWALECVGR